MKFCYFLTILNFCEGFINKIPSLLGTWVLRSTNDEKFKINYTFLTLNENNSIKLKSIILNGMFATKITRYGELKIIKKNNLHFNFNVNPFDINNINIIKENNNINLQLKFNKLCKYSYSFLGIEIPEVKYKQFTDYNLIKNINVKQYDKTIFIIDNDTKLFYLFDLNYNINKLPYSEITLNTLIITQIISFAINIGLVNFIKTDEKIFHDLFN